MTATTLQFTGELVIVNCWCGIRLAIPSTLHGHLHESSSNNCYCPLGHTFVFRKTKVDSERERAEAAEREAVRLRASVDQARAEAEHQRNRVRGYQGALGKAKKRAFAGMCPAPGCKRHFANVAAHVQRMHPDLAVDPVEEVVVT